MERYCDTCGHWFEVPSGSLRTNCRDAGCRQRRQALFAAAREDAKRKLKRRITEVELIEASIKQQRPELATISARAGQMADIPDQADLAKAVRRICRPHGYVALREALLDTAALCVRWAAGLPKPGQQLNPYGTVDAPAREKKPSEVAA